MVATNRSATLGLCSSPSSFKRVRSTPSNRKMDLPKIWRSAMMSASCCLVMSTWMQRASRHLPLLRLLLRLLLLLKHLSLPRSPFLLKHLLPPRSLLRWVVRVRGVPRRRNSRPRRKPPPLVSALRQQSLPPLPPLPLHPLALVVLSALRHQLLLLRPRHLPRRTRVPSTRSLVSVPRCKRLPAAAGAVQQRGAPAPQS